LSRKPPALAVVRQFQSETDAIREAPEPRGARLTVFLLAGMLVAGIAVAALTKVDRIVTSVGGKIVPTRSVNVFQPLDVSLIRSIDVREGQQVHAGQVLATLDATFASANAKQLRQQIASLETQITRLEAELADKPLVFPESSDQDFVNYAALQKSFYDQRVSQYKAQLNSFDAKIKQVNATIARLKGDEGRYQQREEIAKDIETMRTGTTSTTPRLSSRKRRRWRIWSASPRPRQASFSPWRSSRPARC
jgi:hemolysin D